MTTSRSFLVLALLAAGCIPLAKRDHLAAARDAYRHKQFEQCYLELEQIAKSDPNYPEARFGAGTCRWEAGDHDRGLAMMLEARRLAPHTFEVEDKAKRLAEALATAGTRWDVTLPDAARELYAAGPVVLAVLSSGDLVAITPDTKTIAWRVPLGSRVDEGRARPAFDDKRAYVVKIEGSGGTLLALDLATGERAWQVELGIGYWHATAAVAGDTVFVGAKGDVLVAINAGTGAERWRHKVEGSAGSTVIAGDHVCTMTHKGKVACVDRATGESLWTYDAGARASRSRLVAQGDRVYFAESNTVYALDVGHNAARWQQTFDGDVSSPTILDTGAIVISTATSVIALDPEHGTHTWTAKLPELVRGGGHHFEATASKASVTVSSGTGLVMLRPEDGQVLSVASLAGAPSAPATTASDTIVTTAEHKVVALTLAPW